MNKTEAAFANWLEARRLNGEIEGWEFEPCRFRLGNDWKTSYTPDFMVMMPDGSIEQIDVKGGGGWEEKTRVKIKTAARLYPIYTWVGYMRKRSGDAFVREEF